MASIEEMIQEHIASEFVTNGDRAAIDKDYPLIEGGIIDSLGIFMLVPFVEERFGVSVAPEDVVLENFGTIGAIADLVRSKQSEDSGS